MQTAYDKDACHTFFEGTLCMQMLPRECGVGDVSALQQGNVQQCLEILLWPGPGTPAKLPILQRSFYEGTNGILLHHQEVMSRQ